MAYRGPANVKAGVPVGREREGDAGRTSPRSPCNRRLGLTGLITSGALPRRPMSTEPQTQNGHIGIDKVSGLGPVITKLRDRIDELEDRLEAVEADDRQAQLQRVIDHADRRSRGGTVALTYAEVMAAADVSAPTAYSYMDELASEYDRVRASTSGDGTKRILIDPC